MRMYFVFMLGQAARPKTKKCDMCQIETVSHVWCARCQCHLFTGMNVSVMDKGVLLSDLITHINCVQFCVCDSTDYGDE